MKEGQITEREVEFLKHRLSGKFGADAYLAAGYKSQHKYAKQEAYQLERKARVRETATMAMEKAAEEIAFTLKEALYELKLGYERCKQAGDNKNALEYMKEINKLLGFHVERQEIKNYTVATPESAEELESEINRLTQIISERKKT